MMLRAVTSVVLVLFAPVQEIASTSGCRTTPTGPPPPLLGAVRTPPSLAWIGSDTLATRVPATGILSLLPRTREGYRFKQMYWGREIARGAHLPLRIHATGDTSPTPVPGEDLGEGVVDGIRFLNAVLHLPAAGCWTIIASTGDETLSYTVYVEDTTRP